ncbi:hypothetical protein QJQ45_027960, partial [Haematococcus lacustris]
ARLRDCVFDAMDVELSDLVRRVAHLEQIVARLVQPGGTPDEAASRSADTDAIQVMPTVRSPRDAPADLPQAQLPVPSHPSPASQPSQHPSDHEPALASPVAVLITPGAPNPEAAQEVTSKTGQPAPVPPTEAVLAHHSDPPSHELDTTPADPQAQGSPYQATHVASSSTLSPIVDLHVTKAVTASSLSTPAASINPTHSAAVAASSPPSSCQAASLIQGAPTASVGLPHAARPPAPAVAVPMAATRVVMHQIVLPSEVDGSGICFGGQEPAGQGQAVSWSTLSPRPCLLSAAAPAGRCQAGADGGLGRLCAAQVLSWIDICAGMSAKTLARGPCVTAVVGAVHFLRPCRLGAVVIVAAMVHRTFTSSMEVGVRVEAEDMRTGQRHHCCSAYLTFVALGRGQGPRDPPPLPPPSAPALQQQQGPPTPQTTPATRCASAPALDPATAPTAAAAAAGSKGGRRPPLPLVCPVTPDQRRLFEAAEGRRQARQRSAEQPGGQGAAGSLLLCRLQPITYRQGGPTLPPTITINPSRSPAPHASAGTRCPGTPHSPHVTANHPTTSVPSPGSAATADAGQVGPAAASRLLCAIESDRVNDSKLTEGPKPRLTLDQEVCDPPGGSHSPGCDQQELPPTSSSAAPPEPTPQALALHPCSVPDYWLLGSGGSGSEAPAEAQGAAAGGRAAVEGVGRGPRLRTSVRPGLTEAHVTQLIMPQHCNTLGITFGGQVMSWIEQCAYISASRLRAPHVLTAALDSVVFSRSTRLGHMLYVTAIWGSSLEVQVSVHGEDPEIPFRLEPSCPAERLRYEGAVLRRQQRLETRTAFQDADQHAAPFDP